MSHLATLACTAVQYPAMYYIIYGLLYIVSLLPMWFLHLLSDGMYFLIYYLIGYRKKVVLHNLNIAFPQATQKEKERIAKNFYHKFIDSLIETLKLLSAPDAFFEKRFTGNWEEVDKHYTSGRSVQLHLGHNFNWEWGNVVLNKKIQYPVLGVYMPIKNTAFEQLFKKIRTRSGSTMLSAYNMSNDFLPYRGTQYCLGLVADQNPGMRLHKAQWFTFFNRKTPFTVGPAKNAIINNTIVIFAFIERPRRGHYHVTFSLAEEQPTQTTEQALTQKFVQYLEGIIIQNPDMWLWSHRRWKHEWKEEYGFVK